MATFTTLKFLGTLLLFPLLLISCNENKSKTKIGVIQLIEHPALEQTKKGFVDYLNKNHKDFEVRIESAQGNPGLSTQIAQKFMGQGVDMIVAIATIPAQSALRVSEGKIPVVYASVTDPQSAKLQGPNITGVSNYVDPSQQFKMFVQLIPSLKHLGVIYNPGEANSVALLERMKEISESYGITIVPSIANKTAEVTSAAQNLVGRKVDAIFINNDSTALAGFDAIVKVGNTHKVPVFVSDTDFIKNGALAALGPNQYDIGTQAGEILTQILGDKKSPDSIKVCYPRKVTLFINKAATEVLDIKIPSALTNNAKIVE